MKKNKLFVSKFRGGEKVHRHKLDSNIWKVCKEGHFYDDFNHKYYKICRGNIIEFQRAYLLVPVRS